MTDQEKIDQLNATIIEIRRQCRIRDQKEKDRRPAYIDKTVSIDLVLEYILTVYRPEEVYPEIISAANKIADNYDTTRDMDKLVRAYDDAVEMALEEVEDE